MSRSSAAGDVRGEREPLLQEERQRRRPSGNPRPTGHDAGDGYEEEGRRDSRGTQHKAAQLSSVIDAHVREQWPIYRVLLVGLFATMGLTGPASAYFNMSRTLSCAEYYEHYPSHALNSVAPFAAAAPSRGDDAATLCNLDAIEESSNTKLLISDVVGSLVSIFAMLFIGPRLSTWGRKPFLLLACACAGVGYLFFAFLPHGYPYGPHASDMPISPTNVARLFVAAGIFANLVGGQTTIMCCLRLMLTDHSSAATKSRNLMLFQLVFYGGIAVGPGLTAILSALFPLSGETMARGLVNLWSHIQKTAPAADSLHHHPTAAMAPSEPMPLPDKGNAEALNVTAFIAASVFMACAFVITVVLHSGMNKVNHPLTRGRDADGSTEALAAQDESHPSRSSEPALLKHVLPKRDALGRLDWRVSVAMIVAMLHLGTGYCFNIYLQFVGHALHWDAESVGFLLSWLGSARVLTLLGLVPLWVAYFERTTRRPPVLRGMTLDEIKAHGSHARADEPPASDASAFAHATPTQVERDAEASTGRDEREEHQMEKELDGAVAIWRAQVDRRLLALSWSYVFWGKDNYEKCRTSAVWKC